MKKMKLKVMLALMAALVLVPAAVSYAAPAETAEKAKPKKKMAKKPFYTKYAEAMKVAAANEEPVLVLMCFEDNLSKMLEKDLLKNPQFAKDYAKSNLVLLKMRLKKDKTGKKVDVRASFKSENEKRFLENHGLNEKRAAQLEKLKGEKLTALDASNYPALVCVTGDAENQELLFRMDSYDRDGGFGVWLSSLDALLRTKEIEPVVSAAVQKILDDPTAFSGGKKKR